MPFKVVVYCCMVCWAAGRFASKLWLAGAAPFSGKYWLRLVISILTDPFDGSIREIQSSGLSGLGSTAGSTTRSAGWPLSLTTTSGATWYHQLTPLGKSAFFADRFPITKIFALSIP